MTKFWGMLFGINFVMGVTTGLTLEFQFGTNWAYYSHYVGDVFGVPLAIEGLMAFFLESTFVGLFFFGWDRLSEGRSISGLRFWWRSASNLSALWILVANGWMQNPVGAEFNYETMRMELHELADVLFNPVAQVKFVHTVAAGYVTASMFVLGISPATCSRGATSAFALRSFAIACGLRAGLHAFGDRAGRRIGLHHRRSAEGQAGGDRGGMGNARTACFVHARSACPTRRNSAPITRSRFRGCWA